MKHHSKQQPPQQWRGYSTPEAGTNKSISLAKPLFIGRRGAGVWRFSMPLPKWQSKVLLAAFPGIFVALFLNIFQPFTVNNQDGSWRFSMLIAGYGLLATLIILFTEFILRPLSERWWESKKKGLWGEVFWYSWHFLTVALGMLLYRTYLCSGMLTWPPFTEVLTMIYRTCMIGAIPMILLLLGKRLHKQQAVIQLWRTQRISPPSLYLSGENGKEQLILLPSQLLFISSSDNYVEVHYLQNGKPEKQILRSSLTRMQKLLLDHPHIIRCHRSYIVNLQQITFCETKGKGLQLTLESQVEPIPVSNKYKDTTLQLMRGPNVPL